MQNFTITGYENAQCVTRTFSLAIECIEHLRRYEV